MHVPDGFLDTPTSLACLGAAAAALGIGVRGARRQLDDRLAPLTGTVAAFTFGAQMLNFPVAAGTSGHVLGGALAAVLLGPWVGSLAVGVVVAVQALNLYPILYLNLVAALANVDPAMEEAAANLGCTGWRRFRRITLPLINPGLFAGGTLVFIWSFTELGVPLIFDYDRIAKMPLVVDTRNALKRYDLPSIFRL